MALHQDLSYTEEFFLSISNYHARISHAYQHNGRWLLKEDDVVILRVLNFYDYTKANQPVSKPEDTDRASGRWIPPQDHSSAKIVVAEDIDYVLDRTER